MRIIFLDIDGVLNCECSDSRCEGYLGIDDKKAEVLREIVDRSNAAIVLISSWKSGWIRDPLSKDEQSRHADYLDRKLRKHHMRILDKTEDDGWNRGHGIIKWLSERPNVDSWVVLDDEVFRDYEACGILSHLVKTNFYSHYGGLQREHIEAALRILKVKK